MKKRHFISRFHTEAQFNMTAMIDVVFLLIIFFMLICQFISQENYRLLVPDNCAAAVIPDLADDGKITLSVFPVFSHQAKSSTSPSDISELPVLYAIRSQTFDPRSEIYFSQPDRLLSDIAQQLILQSRRRSNPLVYLRADRDLTYSQVQQALLALAQAGVTRLELAAFRSAHSDHSPSRDYPRGQQ